MKVVFLHVGPNLTLVNIMLRSVRKHMPDVGILHITNAHTPVIPGVERVERTMENLSVDRLKALAEIDGEWIALDTDVVVQGDLTHVFDCKFDVGLTRRYAPLFMKDRNITPEMPYNAGVRFSRCSGFWQDAAERCKYLGNEWMGEQMAIADIVLRDDYDVLELPTRYYNYSPSSRDEEMNALAIHYKGEKRKQWMVEQWQTT